MPFHYRVQGVELFAEDIEAARTITDFYCITIELVMSSATQIRIRDVYAADSSGQRLAGIPYDTLRYQPVVLRQQWIEDKNLYKISDGMLEEVYERIPAHKRLTSMECSASNANYQHHGKDYIHFRVKVNHT